MKRTRMKKIVLAVLMIAIMFTSLRLDCFAASYPYATFTESDFETQVLRVEMYKNDANAIYILWIHKYQNEGYSLVMYDKWNRPISSTEKTFAATADITHFTITLDTSSYEPGDYKVVLTKKFYSYLAWREAPSTSELYITLHDGNRPTQENTTQNQTNTETPTQENATPNTSYTEPQVVADREQVQAFVSRLYNVALNRDPEPEGLADWTNRLTSGEAQAVNIVQGIMCSQEYLGKGKTNGEIVNDCYNAMLGRDADPDGYTDWVTKLDNGMTVNAIFAGFVGSQEFANLCNSYGIQPGTYSVTDPRDQNQGVTAYVARLYTQALGRGYDENGLADWCGRILANTSRENIVDVAATGFFHSEEFQNKELSNEDYVKVLYRTFLGRECDPDGLADWVRQLDAGKSRDDILPGFANSQEFTNIMAQYGL